MNKIVVFLNADSESGMVLDSALNLAALFKVEIEICQLVNAPVNWDRLSRSARDKFPTAKQAMFEARNKLDTILANVREKGVKAKKSFYYLDAQQDITELAWGINDLVIVEQKFIANQHTKRIIPTLFALNSAILVISTVFNPESLNDIVLTSDFNSLKPQTSQFITTFYNHFQFNLNLVFINTIKEQQNSGISIHNMKNIIAENGFSNTRISIFYSDLKTQGAQCFADLKGGDFIIMENNSNLDPNECKALEVPLLILNKKND